MVPPVMVKCFLLVLAVTCIMCAAVYNGYFSTVSVELGEKHYAEKIHPALQHIFPKWIKLPLNSLVNIGYVVTGAAWCAYTSVALMRNEIKPEDAKMFYMFNFASCFYGPIQTLRLLTQLHGFGVLDQWYTLPFFMWVFIWGLYCKYGWNSVINFILMCGSISSYLLVFYHPLGFELCLSAHIVFAVVGGMLAWSRNTHAKCRNAFVWALLSCAGFVILKLFDLVLVDVSSVFQYISGHFLSKICDIFQIHFVNRFFQIISFSLLADSKKKEK